MFPFILLYASLVNDVRGLIAQHNQAAAVQAVRTYQSQSGATPELAAALSWLARDALAAKRFDQADSYAAETRAVRLHGHSTSIRLEAAFWDGLRELAREQGVSVAALAADIDRRRGAANLSSALRVHLLESFREKAGR